MASGDLPENPTPKPDTDFGIPPDKKMKKRKPCKPPKEDPCKKTKPKKKCEANESRILAACKKFYETEKALHPEPTLKDNAQEKLRLLREKFKAQVKFPSVFEKYISKHIPKITIDKDSIKCACKCAKDWIIENWNPKKMADKGASAPTRPMKYPYTFSAKFAQFPLKYYINNQWIWKYYFVSVAVCIPVFWSIQNLANSPGNVAKWAEIRRKEAAEHHH